MASGARSRLAGRHLCAIHELWEWAMRRSNNKLWIRGGIAVASAVWFNPRLVAADPLVIRNTTDFFTPPIVTHDLATATRVASFEPQDPLSYQNGGHGVAINGNELFFTDAD